MSTWFFQDRFDKYWWEKKNSGWFETLIRNAYQNADCQTSHIIDDKSANYSKLDFNIYHLWETIAFSMPRTQCLACAFGVILISSPFCNHWQPVLPTCSMLITLCIYFMVLIFKSFHRFSLGLWSWFWLDIVSEAIPLLTCITIIFFIFSCITAACRFCPKNRLVFGAVYDSPLSLLKPQLQLKRNSPYDNATNTMLHL